MKSPRRVGRRSTASILPWVLAASLLAFSSVFGQSVEFRRAVELGQRDRLLQVAPHSTPLEIQLADPDPVEWPPGGSTYPGSDTEAACRLATQYALAQGDGRAAVRAATDCVDTSSSDAAGAQAQLILAQAELVSGRIGEAAARADWLSSHAPEPWKGWGLFAGGQCALAAGDTTNALRLFKQCAKLKSHEAAAPAYLELGRLCERSGQPEQAMRYLTVYRESYPRGLVPEFATTPGASARADQAAGLEYSVQVGVFGDHANAARMADRFREAGYSVELKAKQVAGQKYTAVWVGRYRTQNAAQEARRTLEARFSETYRVVARE